MSEITSQQIKSWALEIGFSLVGIARAAPIDHGDLYNRYLRRGYQGEMTYLERNVEKRLDPRQLVSGAHSIICTATNYYTGDDPVDRSSGHVYGRVARYAWGRDYHLVLKERLRQLADRIGEHVSHPVTLRRFVDSAPVAERDHAARAGLGWIGKNGLLINDQLGSWLLLGEIITDLVLDYDEPAPDRCGACTRCLDACPTGAIVAPHVLDPRKCISYLTIESDQPPPASVATQTGDWVFGCDICQEVCPFNRRAPASDDPDFQPHRQWATLDLDEIEQLEDHVFQTRFAGNAITRTNPQHLKHISANCRKNLAKKNKHYHGRESRNPDIG